jgi:DNA polymerase/3'-5' exonuclease PolX
VYDYRSSQIAFAKLYFTGSDHFNRSMRLYAKELKVPVYALESQAPQARDTD